MAIGFAYHRYLSRSASRSPARSGRASSVHSSIYNSRSEGTDERTGLSYSYRDRGGNVYHKVLLPEGAPEEYRDPMVLWNAVEALERRKDSQVAREVIVALPSDEGMSLEAWSELTETFAQENFVRHGLAVQIDIHAPNPRPGNDEAGDGDGDEDVFAEHLELSFDPAVRDLSEAKRQELVESFAQKHFVDDGRAVEVDINRPDLLDAMDAEVDAAGREAWRQDPANWHAHILITTRRLGPDGFSRTKARDLDPQVRRVGGRSQVVESDHWGELWRAHQDEFFRREGLELRVDPNGIVPQIHLGPFRMRRSGSELSELQELRLQDNREASKNPAEVMKALTRNNATFTERDLDRYLEKHLRREPEKIAEVRAAVLDRDPEKNPELVVLYDPDTGAEAKRFTTRTVRDQEEAAMAAGLELAEKTSGRVPPDLVRAAKASKTLRPDQEAAVDYAVDAGHLKLIEGRAGTGKSYTLSVIREAHEAMPAELDRNRGRGKKVIGLAPTNVAARDMAAEGFKTAATVHSELFKLKLGLTSWDADTTVMVDEAGMMSAEITGELLEQARRSGAKLILMGDVPQLASIERCGLIPQLLAQERARAEALGDDKRLPVEITEVVRQKVAWQKQAARDLAEYRFDKAIAAFNDDEHKAITWKPDQDQARAALVAAWARDYGKDLEEERKRDPEADPVAARFVFAYTNKDVDTLNAGLRQVYRAQGKLGNDEFTFETRRGDPDSEAGEQIQRETFAVGDRVQFNKTRKSPDEGNIYNGNVGKIDKIDPATGRITVRIDGKPGRTVSWDPATFKGFRHGYAGTIYKGQGKTLDRTYLYHTEHWTAAASYVALTRQRESAEVFVGFKTDDPVADERKLVRQMARTEQRSASLAWASADGRTLPNAARPDAAQPEIFQSPPAAGTAAPPAPRTATTPSAVPDAVVPDIAAEIAAGTARFRKNAAARSRSSEGARARFLQNAAAHQAKRKEQARELVQGWDRLIRRYETALQATAQTDRPQDLAYQQAKTALLDYARSIGKHERDAKTLREFGNEVGIDQYPELHRIARHDDPQQVAEQLIQQAERDETNRNRNRSTGR